MDNDPLIEAVAVALSNEQGRTTFLKMAQAAIAAIAAAGYAVVPKEPTEAMLEAVTKNWKCYTKPQLVGNVARMYCEMLAVALVGRKDEPT